MPMHNKRAQWEDVFTCGIEEHDKLKCWVVEKMKAMHNNKSREKHHNTFAKTTTPREDETTMAMHNKKDTTIRQIKTKTQDHGNA